MKRFEELTGLYSLSKTLRFELKPCLSKDQTMDAFWEKYLNSTWFINDEKRWNARKITKNVFDEFHKTLIAEALKDFTPKKMTWEELYDLYNQDKDRSEFSSAQGKMREEIAAVLSSCQYYKYVKSYPELIKAIITKEDKEFL